jgi:uncharacterized protein
MNKSAFSKPLIHAGWLRALLYTIVFGLIAVVARMNTFPEKFRLLYFTLIFFVLCLAVTYVFRRWIDRKSFISLGLDYAGYGRDAVAGGMLSIFIVGVSCLLLKGTGHLKWMDIIFDPKAMFLAFGNILIVAFYEELIFRGYILNNLLASFPKWLALLISALLFMFFHWNSVGFFPMVNMLIVGLILGLDYVYTRNLWFPICFHAGLIFMEGPVMGYSGESSYQTLLQTELTGDGNITGGAYGLEGSLVFTAVSLISGIALYLFLQKKINPQSQPVPDRI